MPTMRSQLFDAQDALYSLLQAATWPGRVSTSLGTPATFETDHVWVSGEVDDWSAEYRVSGLAAKDEAFTIRVHCFTKRLGTYLDARQRVQALGEVVEDTITSNYTLSGTVMLATIGRQQLEESQNEDGRGRQVLLTFFVDCQAHVPAA